MSQPGLQQALELLDRGEIDEGGQLLRQVASSGDPQALFVLADMTWTGALAPKDPARGRLLFEYAAALGHPQANLVFTNLAASGVAGRRDWSTALERLKAEARQVEGRDATLTLLEAMDLDRNGDPVATTEPVPVSEKPYAMTFKGFLTPDECRYLMGTADPLFQPSMVYGKDGQAEQDPIRTSDGAALHWLIEDPAIHALNRRVAKATGTRYAQGEALQILRYAPGQEYRPHFDFLEGTDNPRPWTALIYLNEDYGGGETVFVETDFQFRGRTGDMLLFRNEGSDGKRDPLAKHAGAPIKAGEKYLATRWIRANRIIP